MGCARETLFEGPCPSIIKWAVPVKPFLKDRVPLSLTYVGAVLLDGK